MSSNGSLRPSLTIMTWPLGRWMTRKFCRTAGHLGPAIRLLLAGDCPSANGSRLPSERHRRSRAALLCSINSATAGVEGGGRQENEAPALPRASRKAGGQAGRRRRCCRTRGRVGLRLHEVERLQVLVMPRVCGRLAAAAEAVQQVVEHRWHRHLQLVARGAGPAAAAGGVRRRRVEGERRVAAAGAQPRRSRRPGLAPARSPAKRGHLGGCARPSPRACWPKSRGPAAGWGLGCSAAAPLVWLASAVRRPAQGEGWFAGCN